VSGGVGGLTLSIVGLGWGVVWQCAARRAIVYSHGMCCVLKVSKCLQRESTIMHGAVCAPPYAFVSM
jgi:hypothetical protein